jgi:hypothetical protein
MPKENIYNMNLDDINKILKEAGEGKYALTEPGTKYWGKRGAGILIFCSKTKRFLLLKRSVYVNEPGTWNLISGSVEDKESPYIAALRELKEETKAKNIILRKTPINIFKDGSFSFYSYLGIVEEEFTPVLDWENSSYIWIKKEDFNSLNLHFGIKNLMKKTNIDSYIKENFEKINHAQYMKILNEHTHCVRAHCLICGNISTCRCSYPKKDYDLIEGCFDCRMNEGKFTRKHKKTKSVDSQKPDDVKDQKISNPDTGRKIKVGSALNKTYDGTQVQKSAEKIVQKNKKDVPEKPIEKTIDKTEKIEKDKKTVDKKTSEPSKTKKVESTKNLKSVKENDLKNYKKFINNFSEEMKKNGIDVDSKTEKIYKAINDGNLHEMPDTLKKEKIETVEGSKEEIKKMKQKEKEQFDSMIEEVSEVMDSLQLTGLTNIEKSKVTKFKKALKSKPTPKELKDFILKENPSANEDDIDAAISAIWSAKPKYKDKNSESVDENGHDEINSEADLKAYQDAASEVDLEDNVAVKKPYQQGKDIGKKIALGFAALMAIGLGLSLAPILSIGSIFLLFYIKSKKSKTYNEEDDEMLEEAIKKFIEINKKELKNAIKIW